MSTKTTKKILSPTSTNSSSSSRITTRNSTRQRVSQDQPRIQTRSRAKLQVEEEEIANGNYDILLQQQREINNLRETQLYELEELEEQQLNEIEELSNNIDNEYQRRQILQQQQKDRIIRRNRGRIEENNRLKNSFKFLITILVISIIYGVYTNQFQPKPSPPFHETEPIGHNWMESFKEKSNHWLQLWKDSYKELTRILPLPEWKTLPAGHQLHEEHLTDTLNKYQEKKKVQEEMERMKLKDEEHYKQQIHTQPIENPQHKSTIDNNLKNVYGSNGRPINKAGPPYYTFDEKIIKEVDRQLKPHPAQYPPKDYKRQLENEKLKTTTTTPQQQQKPQHQHDLGEKLSNIEENLKDNLEQYVYKFEERSKEMLHNIQDKKDDIKDILLNEPNRIKKEIDSIIKQLDISGNYNHLLDEIKERASLNPTIENLNELKYKLNDITRESREQFKFKLNELKEKEKEFLEKEKLKFGPENLKRVDQPTC